MEDCSPVEKRLAETLAQREQELEAACEIAQLFLQQHQDSELRINRLLDTERKQQEMIRTLEIMCEELRQQATLNEKHLKKKQQIIDKQSKEMNLLKAELISINEQLLEMDSMCADLDRIRVENKKLHAKNSQKSLDKQNLLEQLYQCNDQIFDLNQKIQVLTGDYRALETMLNKELQETKESNDEKLSELKNHYETEIRRLKEVYESEILQINQVYNCELQFNEYPLQTLEKFDSLKVVRSDTMDTLADSGDELDQKPLDYPIKHMSEDRLANPHQNTSVLEAIQEPQALSPTLPDKEDTKNPIGEARRHQKLTPYEYLFLQRLLLLSKQPHNLTLIFGKRLFMREKFKLLYNILSLLLQGN
ncbi:hypothetical protein HK103_000556 [Boothiomyces macroporosus]|uniref:Uncharacterized protein n=1 Tax=Boothiomyces macroporosus TaxID=261099 RepID=A0AAD5YA58_9FUNG|nr:hypothetical protein HK103_000556 [Boothiomyces macroporosus]